MCGIVGIYSETHVASLIYDSLLMLQHSGQVAAGMVVCDETGRLNSRKSMGYVRDTFQQRHMNKLLGNYGIGHVRYPTAGGAGKEFAQPMYVNSPYGIMGAADVERQSLNVYRIKLLGAKVHAVDSGTATLKDALNEAMRDWVTNIEDDMRRTS